MSVLPRPLVALLVCLACASLALPTAALAGGPRVSKMSASRIKKDLSGKGVVKVDVMKQGGGATWYPSEGRTLWEQTVEVHHKTPWKGVTEVHRGDVVYVWTGHGWKYDKVRPAGKWYEGFTNPTAKDIDAVLAVVGPEAVLDKYTKTKATKLHSVTLADEPKWYWGSPTAVTFHVTAVYDRIQGMDLAKVEHQVKVTMKRSAPEAGFAESCKADPDCVVGGGRGRPRAKVLSKTRVGRKGFEGMKTLHEQARARYIEPRYAALGAPAEWKDLMQFARYAYKALYSGDAKTWEAFVYKSGDESDRYDNGVEVFIDNAEAFRAQFCPELVIKRKTGRKGDDESFMFTDKGGVNECGLQVWSFNGYRVKRVWCEYAVGDEAARIAAIPEAEGCVETLAPDKVYNAQGLKVGEKVMSKWGGTGKEYPGEVAELKEKTVFVKYDDGSYDEVPYEAVRRRDGAPAAKPEPVKASPAAPAAAAADGPHPSGLAVGDKIMSKWHGNGREYPGKVGKLDAKRVFVHYDDGTKEWVPFAAVRKR